MPDDTISIDTLTEAQVTALAQELGIVDDPDELGDGVEPVGGKVEVDPASETLQIPKPTGKDLVDLLRDDPDAQKVIQTGLDNWLKTAAADAAAKDEQDKFQKLIESGDFEAIGKTYVQGLSEKSIREKAEVEVYGQVYASLFSQPELLDGTLTAEEKQKLDHTQYESDDAYIRVLTDFVAEKRAGASIEDRVTKTLNERIETLKNLKTQQTVSDPSVSSLPGGSPHSRANEKQTSSSLIADGYREMFEANAERVGAEVA
jgi:hypothetical protein